MSDLNPDQPRQDVPSELDAEVQRELDEALQGGELDALMQASMSESEQARDETAGDAKAGDEAQGEQAGPPPEFHHEIRRGRIAAVRGEDVFVDLVGETGKMQGLVPLAQFERPPRIGSIMDFVVDQQDEQQGLIFLSREGAVSRSTWEMLQRGAVVEARVTATNKGGLELEMIGGIRAFMPASQIDLHHVDDMESLVGQKLEAMVQEINRRNKKVVISRRQLLQHRREQAKAKVLAELEVGQIREGKVSNVVEFGAFVDLGGVDGLVHVSDMSYTHIDKPTEVVTPGQDVRVVVLKIDHEHQRISLGMKQAEPDPWEGIEGRLQPGGQVQGKVIRTTNFGAFVEVLPGVEGLLPLSEMSWRRIGNAEQVVKAGDQVRLAVLNVDPAKRRISLSLKQAQGDPWVGAERKYEARSVAEGKVLSTTEFGAFIELEPGVEGLVHISELSDRRVNSVQDVLKSGDVKPFRILEVDEDQRRIRLSLKQVEKMNDEVAAERAEQAAAASQASRHTASKRAPRKDLKGGMGTGGALGQGLGDLKL